MTTEPSGLIVHAWIELPFFLGVQYTDSVHAEYRPGVMIEMRFELHNDLHKLVSGNYWQYERELEEHMRRRRDGEDVRLPRAFFIRYTKADRLESEVKQLAANPDASYVHVEKLSTVLEWRGVLTGAVRSAPDEFDSSLLPSPAFFPSVVWPRLRAVVDAYRIAVLPAMRYKVLPVSEALLDSAFMEVEDKDGVTVQQWRYGFRGSETVERYMYRAYGVSHRLQERFESALSRLDDLDVENQFGAAYYLFHLERWAEALAIASSVVDRLTRQAIDKGAQEPLASAIWDAYRNRYKDLFNKVLPGLGFPKLSEVNGELWRRFMAARELRGRTLHGGEEAPGSGDAAAVKTHLSALYGAARWLSSLLGRDWALDLPAGDERQSFP